MLLHIHEIIPRLHHYVSSTESTAFVSNDAYRVRFRITIQREPLYFTFNIGLPILLLGLLNGFVFLLPAESGERIGIPSVIIPIRSTFFDTRKGFVWIIREASIVQ